MKWNKQIQELLEQRDELTTGGIISKEAYKKKLQEKYKISKKLKELGYREDFEPISPVMEKLIIQEVENLFNHKTKQR